MPEFRGYGQHECVDDVVPGDFLVVVLIGRRFDGRLGFGATSLMARYRTLSA